LRRGGREEEEEEDEKEGYFITLSVKITCWCCLTVLRGHLKIFVNNKRRRRRKMRRKMRR